VSQFTVRDYSDLGLLGPVQHPKNSTYRAFDPRQIPQMYMIKALREMGLMPQEIRDFGQNRTPEEALRIFRHCSEQLSDKIAALQAKQDIFDSHIAHIEEGMSANPGAIEVRTLPERRIQRCDLEHHKVKTKYVENLRHAHGKIRYSSNPACPLGYAYNDFLGLLEQPEQPAQLISYDPQGPDIRPAGEYLVGTVACFYGEKNGLAQRMLKHALQNGLELHGPAYTVYLLDAASVTGPDEFLMQVAVGVA
jgi:DNA-binding transcriptional MerR regulator